MFDLIKRILSRTPPSHITPPSTDASGDIEAVLRDIERGIDTDYEHVNARRRADGRKPLTISQYATASREARDGGFDVLGYCIGYTTGIPIGLTTGAILGASMFVPNPSAAAAEQSRDAPTSPPRDEDDRRPAYVPPVYVPDYNPPAERYEPSAPSSYTPPSGSSYDSGSSSYSSGSSYDSGSSSSGGGFD